MLTSKSIAMTIVSNCFFIIVIFHCTNAFQFPSERKCNASSILGNKAICVPQPTIEDMMDHIVLNGKKLSTIKRLNPGHVRIHQCAGMIDKVFTTLLFSNDLSAD